MMVMMVTPIMITMMMMMAMFTMMTLNVQAEGWIAGEGEKGVESGQIAEDHIYQSA